MSPLRLILRALCLPWILFCKMQEDFHRAEQDRHLRPYGNAALIAGAGIRADKWAERSNLFKKTK